MLAKLNLPLLMLLLTEQAKGHPVRHDEDGHVISFPDQFQELPTHVSHKFLPNLNHLGEIQAKDHDQDPSARFPGPIPIDIEEIKKIAQLLAFIGDQVLPNLISPAQQQPPKAYSSSGILEMVNDSVNADK